MANLPEDRIFLWFNVRSLSTAFAKCVSFMDGAHTWIEPYAASFANLVFSTPEYLAKFPKMNTIKSGIEDATKEIDNFDHYFNGGNLAPVSYFKFGEWGESNIIEQVAYFHNVSLRIDKVSYDWVQQQLEKPIPGKKSFMFVKDSAMCIQGFYDKLPRVPFRHTFLIREPWKEAKSYRTAYKLVFLQDEDQDSYDMYESNPAFTWDKTSKNPVYSLWKYVKEKWDPSPVVIDADDLQNYPDQILRKYCEAVGIPYKEEYLQWPESDKSLKNCYGSVDQMVWGKKHHVYDAAFSSSCFRPTSGEKPAFEDLTPDVQRYVIDKREGYEEMYLTRIKPDV